MSTNFSPEKWEAIMSRLVDASIQRKQQYALEYVDINEEITEENVSALAKALKSHGIVQFTNSYFGLSGASGLIKKMAGLRKNGFSIKTEMLIPDYIYNHNLGISNDSPDAFMQWALLFEQIG